MPLQADVLRINGAATSPMDAIAIEQAQKELFAVASFMKFGQLGYAPEWTTLDKNTGASPQAKPNFAQKHPHLVLAMQLGLAVKAIEVRGSLRPHRRRRLLGRRSS
jgi:hypothetical protein